MINEIKCNCVYAGEPHGIEFIDAPSGMQIAIGGTDTEDRFLYCPWCGGYILRPRGRRFVRKDGGG